MKKLIKHGKLRFLIRCMKNFNNKQFIYDVNHIYHNPHSVFIQNLGHENEGKLIYPIEITSGEWGFWACMRRFISNLWYANYNGFTPHVQWNLDNCLYAERPGFMNTNNVFEYYFNPIKVENIESSCAVVKCFDKSNPMFGNRISTVDEYVNSFFYCKYRISEKYLEQMGNIWNKYFVFNDKTYEEVCNTEIIKKIKHKKTVGVHVRGTDYRLGIKGHPVKIEESAHIEYIRNMDVYEQIFLATDEEQVIECFEREFPGKVIYYNDILRSTDGKPVHFSNCTREHHHYLLGIEILKDSYALAKCDALVCGVSQVTNGVQVIKAGLGEKYADLHIIDSGIH